jgi:GAF domain-containing protein
VSKESGSADFEHHISIANSAVAVWTALETLSSRFEGHRLFTVTVVDMQAELARRVFSSHPFEYPVTGTKPIYRDAWFEIVHGQRRSFVANTISDIAKVFPDFELIKSLGCGAVINLPVVLQNELVATVNLLHVEQHYTEDRVRLLETTLALPARLCWALASQYGGTQSG